MGAPAADVVIVGSGPGGYVAALRAAQLGMKPVLIERAALGGVCLNRGCIPTTVLRYAATRAHDIREAERFGLTVGGLTIDYAAVVRRRERVIRRLRGGVASLLKQAGVPVVYGSARLLDPTHVEVVSAGDGHGGVAPPLGLDPAVTAEVIEAPHIVLATGSVPVGLQVPGADHPRVVDSNGGLALTDLPRRLLVVGGGAIGCEWSIVFARLGVQVTLVELGPSILPLEEPEISGALAGSLRKEGIVIHTGTTVASISEAADYSLRVELEGDIALDVDYVLVAAGRLPLTEGLGLEEVGVRTGDLGFVVVDEMGRSSVPSILAIGDLTGRNLRSHVAVRQAVITVESLAGLSPSPLRDDRIPAITFSEPETGSVGLTEATARAQGYSVATGLFPLSASGRAVAMGSETGLVKVVADRQSGRVLGVHMVGAHAGELVGQAVIALELGATLDDLVSVSRSHPTLWETLGEASLAALGRPLHMPAGLGTGR